MDENENIRFHSHIFVSIPAHPSSWNSRILKVQKHDNKQNFDYSGKEESTLSVIDCMFVLFTFVNM